MDQKFVLMFAWCWITIGLISGTLIGLRFWQVDWLGGYDSWTRRMIRLGHIAFLGTGLLTIAAVFSFRLMNFESIPAIPALGFVVGSISMPTICFLSAFRKPMRHLFAIPVISLLTGAIATAFEFIRASI